METNNYQGVSQQPVNSGFNAKSATVDVIKGLDLNGRTAIVTGGNTGIGLETTKVLAAAGAAVIVPAKGCRKGRVNPDGIKNVEIEPMDVMDPVSMDAFAKSFFCQKGHCTADK